MKKLFSLLFLTGCLANNTLGTATAAQKNVYGLSRLTVGMEECQVLDIMHHPHTKQTIAHGGITYDFWFYVTRPTGLNQSRLVRQNLTPLTFIDGILKGWGFAFYNHTLKKTEEPPKKEHHQDKAIEKALDPEDKPSPGTGKHEDKAIEKALDETKATPSTSYNDGKKTLMVSPPKKKAEGSKDDEDEKSGLGEEGRKMREEESDQNFNFW